MASVHDVWGPEFGKKAHKPEKRDPEKEGRVYSTPQKRTAAAIQTHRKTIDDLTKSLPIVNSEEGMTKNFGPQFAYVPDPEPIRGREDFQMERHDPTNDMILYIFTGLVFLFTLDAFVRLGRRSAL